MSYLKELMEAELRELDFTQSGFQLKPLQGGAVNSSYCLETADATYFVKTFESDKVALLDRKELFSLQKKLATQKLAINPVYLSKNQDFQIDCWLDAPTLDSANISSLKTTKKLAFTLSQIHGTAVDAPELDLPYQWQHYIQLIGKPISASEQLILERYTAVWGEACLAKAVLCHNDLALSHVTSTEPSKVFDWEYCAISCPYFDVASCIAVNALGIADEASLCAFYAQYTEQRLSEVVANVTNMKPLVELTNKLWYQAAQLSS